MDFPSVSSTSILYWFPWFVSRNFPLFKHIEVSQQVGIISQQYLRFTVYPYKDSGFNPHKRQNSHENWQAFRLSTHQYPHKRYQVPMESLVEKPHHCEKHGHRRQLTPQFRPVDGMQSLWSPWTECHWMPSLTWKYVSSLRESSPFISCFSAP